MKFLKYSWFAVLLVFILASCALPAMTVRIPPANLALATAWEGGPPMATEEAAAEATAVVLATEEAPQEASTPEPVECLVKGNVSKSGEKIYHVQGGVYYDRVVVDESQGDGWYCSPEQAEAAGFRASTR